MTTAIFDTLGALSLGGLDSMGGMGGGLDSSLNSLGGGLGGLSSSGLRDLEAVCIARPQALDATLDLMAFNILARLRRGVHFVNGMSRITRMLQHDKSFKPLFVVLAHSLDLPNMDDVLRLRLKCAAASVPVVHALTPAHLALLCNKQKRQIAVAVTALDPAISALELAAFLSRGALAYKVFFDTLAAALGQSTQSMTPLL